jgi:magnesium transporter
MSEARETLIRISTLEKDNLLQGGLELLAGWTADGPSCIWIDICFPTQADIEPLLEEWFCFHELAAEDALSPATLPKYDSFPKYDFFVFRSIRFDISCHGIDTEKLSCFLGSNFLFTIHRDPLPAVDSVWNRLPQDRRMAHRGVDFLLYSVLDLLVDQHFPLLESIEEHMDSLHEEIFSNPSQDLLSELLNLKRDLNVLRRQTLPQRDLFNQISRGETKFIQQPHLIYFRDLYDHMFRIGESIDSERDLATSTMEAYLSVIANRTNEIMKVLTVFSAIMLPLTLIAGIYGMNFVHMPELQWHYGYGFALGLMAIVTAIMLYLFRRRGWIGKHADGLIIKPHRNPMVAEEKRE